MSTQEQRAEAAKACLDFNKHLKEVHVTDDLNCFPSRHNAVNHARTLENKDIEVFERDGEAEVISDEVKSTSETNEANTKPDHKLANAKAQGKAKGAEFKKTGPAKKASPAKIKPAKTEPTKTEPAKTEAAKTEPAKTTKEKTKKAAESKPIEPGTV